MRYDLIVSNKRKDLYEGMGRGGGLGGGVVISVFKQMILKLSILIQKIEN